MGKALDVELIYSLKTSGHSNYAVGEILGVSERAVRRALTNALLAYEPHLLAPAEEEVDDIADYFIEIEKPLVIEGPVAIAADLHAPLFKISAVNAAILRWRAAGLRTLVFAGDFWMQDGLSAFEYKQASANLARELRVGNYVMEKLFESFDRIVMTYANHDARFVKALGYKLKFAESMRLLFGELPDSAKGKLEITNLDYVIVQAGGQTYRICHPKDYSATPLANARKLCSKYQTHVLCGHSHHSAIGSDVSGKFIAAELGGFFDTDKTEYMQRSTAHPTWTNGYGGIGEDGRFWLESDLWGSQL